MALSSNKARSRFSSATCCIMICLSSAAAFISPLLPPSGVGGRSGCLQGTHAGQQSGCARTNIAKMSHSRKMGSERTETGGSSSPQQSFSCSRSPRRTAASMRTASNSPTYQHHSLHAMDTVLATTAGLLPTLLSSPPPVSKLPKASIYEYIYAN